MDHINIMSERGVEAECMSRLTFFSFSQSTVYTCPPSLINIFERSLFVWGHFPETKDEEGVEFTIAYCNFEDPLSNHSLVYVGLLRVS